MKVLLTGGSGEVGRHLLELLYKDSRVSLVTFDRDISSLRRWYRQKAAGARLHFGDLSQKETLPSLHGIDAVIHLAALIPPYADQHPDEAYRVNVEGTANLLNRLQEDSPGAFFIYSSSISVYGDRMIDPEICVGDLLKPSFGDAYALTKIQAEEVLEGSTLDWTTLRLTAVMGGLNHRPSGLLFHMPLDTSLEIISPEDAARAFHSALYQRESLRGRTYNLGGGGDCRISYRDFLDRSFVAIGLGKPNFPETAFAERNFHCGYYADGDALEAILHFRQDNLEDYLANLKASVSPLRYRLTKLVRRQILRRLLKASEPYRAWKTRDRALMYRFFNVRASLFRILKPVKI